VGSCHRRPAHSSHRILRGHRAPGRSLPSVPTDILRNTIMVCLQQLALLAPTLRPTRWQQSVSTARRRRRRGLTLNAYVCSCSTPSFSSPSFSGPSFSSPSISSPSFSSPANSAIPADLQIRMSHRTLQAIINFNLIPNSNFDTTLFPPWRCSCRLTIYTVCHKNCKNSPRDTGVIVKNEVVRFMAHGVCR